MIFSNESKQRKKEVRNFCAQNIKFFDIVDVKSLSPKNLNVNSFSLNEFCKPRSKASNKFLTGSYSYSSLSICLLPISCNNRERKRNKRFHVTSLRQTYW